MCIYHIDEAREGPGHYQKVGYWVRANEYDYSTLVLYSIER